LFESRRDGGLVELRIIARFGFGRRNVSDRLQQPSIVEPVDPFERGELDLFEAAPWLCKFFSVNSERAIVRSL
jgi:hypothetical protein